MNLNPQTVDNRKIWFDLMRIAAAFAVVLTHVTRQGVVLHAASDSLFSWLSLVFYNSCVRWQNGVFFMISGALLLGKDRSISKLYKKNILRIAVAYFAWSAIYTVLWSNNLHGTWSLLKKIIDGKEFLWFLPKIAGLYMLTPVFRLIVKNKRCTKYYLLITFIFCFINDQAAGIIGLFSRRLSSLISESFSHFGLGLHAYCFYFVWGYCLSNIKINRKRQRIITSLGLLGFASTVAGTVLFSVIKGRTVFILWNHSTVNALLEATLVFTLFRKLFENRSFSEKAQGIITKASKWTFGIYLIHFNIIYILEKFGISALSFAPIISAPILAVFIFAVSMLISAILNKIPIVNKYIV